MEMLSTSHTDHEKDMNARYIDLMIEHAELFEENQILRKEIRRLENENWTLKRKRKF